MKELNIRAAKCLGYKLSPKHEHVWITPDGISLVHEVDFKFTTSYDWAMLGVKEVLKTESSPKLFCALYRIKEFEKQFNQPDEPNYTSEWEWYMTSWLFSFKPEQIAQACVEVLETTLEEKKN